MSLAKFDRRREVTCSRRSWAQVPLSLYLFHLHIGLDKYWPVAGEATSSPGFPPAGVHHQHQHRHHHPPPHPQAGSVSATKVLPIPHQQFSLSLKQNLALIFWLCQLSGVAHLLLWEDGEQLKAGEQLSPRSDDCSTHRRRCGGASVAS